MSKKIKKIPKKVLVHATMQRNHSKQRVKDRFSIDVDAATLRRLACAARSRGGAPRLKITRTRYLRVVELDGEQYSVIYDKKTNVIATVLPMPYTMFGEMSDQNW